MSRVTVSVRHGNETLAEGKNLTLVEAIVQLQSAIAELRAIAQPVFDASWGEQPQPLIAPNADELHAFINR